MNTLVEQIDIQDKKLNTPIYKNIDDRYCKNILNMKQLLQ